MFPQSIYYYIFETQNFQLKFIKLKKNILKTKHLFIKKNLNYDSRKILNVVIF